MMNDSITLNGEKFPLAVTGEGEKFLRMLNVDMNAVEFGVISEKLKYAYCMAAGAALAEKKEFPFTLQQFTKALPGDWMKKVNEFKVQSLKFKVEKGEQSQSQSQSQSRSQSQSQSSVKKKKKVVKT